MSAKDSGVVPIATAGSLGGGGVGGLVVVM